MPELGPPEVRRLSRGSIDIDHYVEHAKRCRQRAFARALARLRDHLRERSVRAGTTAAGGVAALVSRRLGRGRAAV